METMIRTADYRIINGKRLDVIDESNYKMFLKREYSSGSGDQSYWCEFRTVYGVYRQKDGVMKRCGKLTHFDGTDGSSWAGNIDGKYVSPKLDLFKVFAFIVEK